MPDLNSRYEKQLQQAITQAEKQIRKIYEQAILEISVRAAGTKPKNIPFSISSYPLLNSTIERKIKKMHQEIYKNLVKSIEKSWHLANKKTNEIVDKRLAGKTPSKRAKQILYDPNKQGFDAFIRRKEKGLNLSDRVWNTLDPFKREMEQALGLAINKGMSAATMSREVRSYLNEPSKLFRRVRTEEGKLVLSKAARDYHPGQGVYRSSYKNALRLTRTENNIAYRTADHERWETLPFVKGIEIKLSKMHPVYDICDTLQGKYPKDFKFTGWHPQCLCYQTPVMMNDEEYDKMEDEILATGKAPEAEGIEQPPVAFKDFLKDNQERIAKWKNKPYWIRDNEKFVKEALRKK